VLSNHSMCIENSKKITVNFSHDKEQNGRVPPKKFKKKFLTGTLVLIQYCLQESSRTL